jgi:hypothetical protein
MCIAELTRYLPHRIVGGAEIILQPCMGGYRVVARNGPTDLSTKMVKNGTAWRVLDDELEQLHRRIGQAPSGFDEIDSEVIRVRGEVPDTELVCSRSGFAGPKRRQQLGG